MTFRRYPICDTDVLVNCCKVSRIENLFDLYSKINISDAVFQEINHNKNKNIKKSGDFKKDLKKNYFGKTHNHLNNMLNNGQANLIEYYKIDENKRSTIDILLFEQNISYDKTNNCYELYENLGETVSIIYAAVLRINVVLSDDRDSLDFADRFHGLKVIRLEEILKKIGIEDPDELAETYVLSKQDDPIEAKEVLVNYKLNSSVNQIVYVKMIDEFKKVYKRNRCS